MTFFRRDMMEDMAGDLSDVSDVSADELAKMVGDASNLDDEIFGFGKTSTTAKKEQPVTKPATPKAAQHSSPLQGRRSEFSARKSGLDDSLDLSLPDGDSLLPKTVFPSSSRFDKKDDDKGSRGDWLGLKEEKALGGANPAANRSLPLGKTDGGAATAKSALATGGDDASRGPLPGRRPSTSGDKASLMQDLFGSSWGQTPQNKTEEVKEPTQKTDESYVPSLGGGSRRPGRRREPSPSTFNFDDLDMGAPAIASLSRPTNLPGKSKIPDWLGGGDSIDQQGKGVNVSQSKADEKMTIEQPKSLTHESQPLSDQLKDNSAAVQQTPQQGQQQQTASGVVQQTQPMVQQLQVPAQQFVPSQQALGVNPADQQGAAVQQQVGPIAQQSYPVVQPLAPAAQQHLPVQAVGQSQIVPLQSVQQLLPFSGNPINYLLQANAVQPADGENTAIVDKLASAQANLGIAMAKHHVNMHSYMQLLLDEARRLAVVAPKSNVPKPEPPKAKRKPSLEDLHQSSEEESREEIREDTGVESSSSEDANEVPDQKAMKTGEEANLESNPPPERAVKKRLSINKPLRNHREENRRRHKGAQKTELTQTSIIPEMELMINELKVSLQNLELENFNLKMKLESIKSSHEIEITSLKKSSEQDALLWEARIGRIQNFCLDLEREYNNKIDKMRANEEELIISHKAKVEALQNERISDIQQLGDLHKVILEQALNVTVMYPQYRSGGMKLPIRLAEKPTTHTELTEREAALMDKERYLEVLKSELEAARDAWEEEKKRSKEELDERAREVKELESEWRAKREREERELARREGRVEGLAKRVEEMREEAVAEAAGLARERLEVTTQRARLDAVLRSETGEFLPNADHLLQVRAEAEAGLHESRKVQSALDSERRRQADMERRLQHWNDELEHREREAEEKVRRAVADARDATEAAQRAEERAQVREAEAAAKAQMLEKQLADLARDKLEIAKEKFEIDSAKTRLDLLLPELTPMESLSLRPPKNYVDPKALIMKLKAERELEAYSLPKKKYS